MKNAFLIILSTLASGVVYAETMDGVTPPPPPKPECDEIVYSKWNDLLFVDNGEDLFVSYQWYKDQNPISGETKQYIYTEGVVLEGDGHIYYVIATTKEGKQIVSCEGYFEDFPESHVYNEDAPVRKAALYSYTGHKVGEWAERPANVAVASGMYVWRMTDSLGHTWTEKVVY